MLQQQLFTFHQFADRAKMSVWISSRLRSALFTCLLYAVCTELANCQSSKNLYFSFTTAHSTGYSALGAVPAIDLALQRINDEPSILPGYNLSYAMNVGNSLCDETASLDEFFSRLFNSSQPKYVAMLCCGCSVAAIPVAKISHHWNIPQMAYAAASLTLNNRNIFRNFFRTMPVYTNMGIAVADLAKQFDWQQLAVVTQSNGLFTPVLNSLIEVASERNLRLHSHALESVNPFPYQDLFDWDEDYRVIFINAYSGVSQMIACEAYRRGLYGPQYVWITVNWGEGWWEVNPNSTVSCTTEQLISVLDRGLNIIPRGFFLRDDKDAATFSGITPAVFDEMYTQRIQSEGFNFYSRYGLSYDAMWAIALGLNNTLTRILANNDTGCEDVPGSTVPLEEMEYNNTKMGCLLRESFLETRFSGVTGDIMFNRNGSRISSIVTTRQYRRTENDSLMMTVIGVVNVVAEEEDNNTFEFHTGESPQTLWPGGVPYDGSAINIVHPIALPLIIIYDVLATVGVLFAIACAVFNVVFRKKKVVKLSSPNLNYLIILGTSLLFFSVYLYNYTADSVDNVVVQTVICNFRQWSSAIGYTLCFAVILSKTWRIYYIFNNPTKKKKAIHDWVLLLIVGIVVTVDVVIHLVGTAPPQIRIEANWTSDVEHPSNINAQGFVERYFIFVCANNAITWLIISYAYKGLLQLVAMFMAFHVRKVKIRALNDSKEIAVIVYINSITLVLLAVTEFSLRQFHYLYAALYGTALLIGGYLFLSLIFVPKMVSLYRDPEGDQVFKVPPITQNEKMPSSSVFIDQPLTITVDKASQNNKETDEDKSLRARPSKEAEAEMDNKQ